MPVMATPLTVTGINGTTITYALAAHTASKPAIALCTRKEGSGSAGNLESSFQVVHGTLDAAGALVQSRAVVELRVKYPKNGDFAQVTSGLTIAKDVLASDEFLALVQKHIPPKM